MPHINIKHFPTLSKEQQAKLTTELTRIISNIIKCDDGAISIALEPIEKELWYERVYYPEIVNRRDLLCKYPNY